MRINNQLSIIESASFVVAYCVIFLNEGSRYMSSGSILPRPDWSYIARYTTRRKLLGVLLALSMFGSIPAKAMAEEWQPSVVKQVVTDQVTAWNRGDIDGFVSYYKDSRDTISIVDGNILHGRQEISDCYKQKPLTRESMGTLDVSDLHVLMLGSKLAIVTGNFHLARARGTVSGVLSVVCQRTSRGWKIIQDYNNYN